MPLKFWKKFASSRKNNSNGKDTLSNGSNGSHSLPYHQRDPSTWTTDDVCLWLSCIGFSDYTESFAQNDISGEELLDIRMADMEPLGIVKLGHKKKLLNKLNAIRPGDLSSDNNTLSSSSYSNKTSKTLNTNTNTNTNTHTPSSIPNGNNSTSFLPNTTDEISVADDLLIKCIFSTDNIRLLSVTKDDPPEYILEQIREEAENEYSVPGTNIRIRFQDVEGDFVTLRNENDMKAALACSRSSSVLKLWVTSLQEDTTKDKAIGALKPLNNLLQTTGIIESLADGAVMIDTDCIIRFANKATEKIFQYSDDEMVGHNVSMLMPEALAKQHDHYVQRYLRSGEKKIIGTNRKVTGRRKDGMKVPLWLTISEHRHENEHGFIGTMHLAQSYKNLSSSSSSSSSSSDGDNDEVDDDPYQRENDIQKEYSVMQNLTEAALVTGSNGSVVYLNQAAEELLGHNRANIVGRNVKIIVPSIYRDSKDEKVKDFVKKGGQNLVGQKWNTVIQTKMGSLVPVTISLSRNEKKDGRVFYLAMIREREDSSDTEPKSGLQQEREVINNLALPGIIIDERCHIQGFNKAACKTLGYKMMEVLGKNVKLIVPPGHREHHGSYVQRYLQTGEQKIIGTAGRSVEGVAKDGSHIPLWLSVTERRIDDHKSIFTAILHPREA